MGSQPPDVGGGRSTRGAPVDDGLERVGDVPLVGEQLGELAALGASID
jgi:hypothetical protein